MEWVYISYGFLVGMSSVLHNKICWMVMVEELITLFEEWDWNIWLTDNYFFAIHIMFLVFVLYTNMYVLKRSEHAPNKCEFVLYKSCVYYYY